MTVVLDGCCGAGGAARGYVDADHEVWGIDSAPQPNYMKSGAAGFKQMDILEALASPWIAKIGFVHCSPPCQFYSAMSSARPGLAASYPDLIGPVRELLNATGKPYVIENVEAARPWLKDPVTLCAQMFRPASCSTVIGCSRRAAASPWPRRRLRLRACQAAQGLRLASPGAGQPGRRLDTRARPSRWPAHVGNVALARRVMEIDWTTREELAEAIPPYYAEWIGRQLGAAR